MRSGKAHSRKKIVGHVIVAALILVVLAVISVRLDDRENDKSSVGQLSAVSSALHDCLPNRKLAPTREGLKSDALEFSRGIFLTLKRLVAPDEKIARCGSVAALSRFGFLLTEKPDVTVTSTKDAAVFMIYVKKERPTVACRGEVGLDEYDIRIFYDEGNKVSSATQCNQNGTVPQIMQYANL